MRVKIFLFWLLAMAIPVQGFAAAVQVPCAASAHAVAAQTAPATERHDAGHVIGQHQHKASNPACHACGACSIGAILPLPLDSLVRLPLMADRHIATAQYGFTSHTPEHPERPPSLPVSSR